MGKLSKIEWTEHTFNSHWGCSKVPGDPACHNCYAEAFSRRLGLEIWGGGSARRFFSDKHWAQPLKWDRAAGAAGERHRVFCASMADVFEDREDLSAERERLWRLIDATPNLDWLLLTKRPENIPGMLATKQRDNVWLGTTLATQEWVEPRVPALLKNEAAIHFVSCEPLLGLIDLSIGFPGIDWVIAGAESGGKARPMDLDWVRGLRDQSVEAAVPFLFKQDARKGLKIPTPELDGRMWVERPGRSEHDGVLVPPELAGNLGSHP
jgi:protein gp37